ncbi:hypothetical protein SDC9_175524 [bioreactor metagenome]|uniref:Uncharacterized protein n=1 Tax=bioreactor metagenome TaxID=1076179 RepID=A0A645GMX3_9ZZZZ
MPSGRQGQGDREDRQERDRPADQAGPGQPPGDQPEDAGHGRVRHQRAQVALLAARLQPLRGGVEGEVADQPEQPEDKGVRSALAVPEALPGAEEPGDRHHRPGAVLVRHPAAGPVPAGAGVGAGGDERAHPAIKPDEAWRNVGGLSATGSSVTGPGRCG